MSPLRRHAPQQTNHHLTPRRCRLPQAVAQALLAWLLVPSMPPAQAKVEVIGHTWTDPYYPFLLEGNFELPNTRLWLGPGSGAVMRMTREGVLDYARVQLGGLYIGAAQGTASVWLDDQSALYLYGNYGRLNVGDYGYGGLSIANGSALYAKHNADVFCGTQNFWCGAIIGAAAGSTGIMTLTDPGSKATFYDISVGATHLDASYGTPGGTTYATLNVLNGAELYTDSVFIADNFTSPLGSESIFSTVRVDGAGSLWRVGDAINERTHFNVANNLNSHANVVVSNGGVIAMIAPWSTDYGMSLGANGGNAEMLVTGVGSAIELPTGSIINMATGNAAGSATLSILDGAKLTGGGYMRIGDNGGRGALTISGTGARVELDIDAGLHLGAFNNGYGKLSVLNGGYFSVHNIWAGDGGSANIIVDGAGSWLNSTFPAGPGNDIQLGMNGYAELVVSNGGTLTARGISMGNQPTAGYSGGTGNVTVTGTSSRILLDATAWHRIGLERGTLTVSAGGLLDAGDGQTSCWSSWCGAFIGFNAGADANVVVTGSGSRAVFVSNLNVGAANAGRMPTETYNYGIPGGVTRASVSVLDGGRLETTAVRAGIGSTGSALLGSERIEVDLKVIGPDSVWAVTGIPGATWAAAFSTGIPQVEGSGNNVNVDLQILQGGKLQLGQAGQSDASMVLGAAAGRTTALVSGNGSVLEFLADENYLGIGLNDAYASLSFTRGAQLLGGTQVLVGFGGGRGELSFDASSALLGSSAMLQVGVAGGDGYLSLLRGSVFDFGSGGGYQALMVGYGNQGVVDTRGTLLLSGGSAIRMTAGSGNDYNPNGVIGYKGTGSVTIRGGSSLVMDGRVAPLPDNYSATQLQIGTGSSQYPAGAYGSVQITGAGSLLEVKGYDASIYAGSIAGAIGQITVQDNASLRTTFLQLGSSGGSASLFVDHANVALSGQHTGNELGASLVLGVGNASFGSANLTRNASLTVSNAGSAGAGITVGSLGGTGILNASGGSQITISAVPGHGYVKLGEGVGSNGTMTLTNAALNVAGGQVLLASDAGGTAALSMSNQSTLYADYVGVGSSRQGDGGNGRLIINNSTLSASLLEVGSQGYVGGNGTLQAAIINRGTFSPGNSPGTLIVNGSFFNESGGKLLLEIEADGLGGYVTDHLLFMAGSVINMRDLQVTFRFLGATDPNAFLASGAFDIDQFIALQNGNALDHALFSGVSYAVRSDHYRFENFQFTADGGASFMAAPVPEPSSWLMLAAGLALMAAFTAGRKPAGWPSSPYRRQTVSGKSAAQNCAL